MTPTLSNLVHALAMWVLVSQYTLCVQPRCWYATYACLQSTLFILYLFLFKTLLENDRCEHR